MQYNKTITLKNDKTAVLRNGTAADGTEIYRLFYETHAETDFLLSYPEENSHTEKQEADFLKKMEESANGIEILAIVDGHAVGTACIEAVGSKYKVRHRATFGITVSKAYWNLGIGRALTNACIECAKHAGFTQLELTAVAENTRAINLYKSVGFLEFGRNPKGFCSKASGYQETVLMLLPLC